MKKALTIIFLTTLIIFTTGCGDKEIIDYINEKETNNNKTIAYIEMKKSDFKKIVTKDEFKSLMEYIKDQEYEYLIVAFSKNKGLYCLSPNCVYEKIKKDSNGNYIPTGELYGRVEKGDDGVYRYVDFKKQKENN